MNITEIEQLVQLVSGANIGELTLRQGDGKITIRKPANPAPASNALTLYSSAMDSMSLDTLSMEEGDFALDMETAALEGAEETAEDIVIVKSPRVGAFRHARNPVVLGATVREGQVLGGIEAMKLLSDVPAPTSGKIVEVFIEDGQFAEYDQDLYAIQVEA